MDAHHGRADDPFEVDEGVWVLDLGEPEDVAEEAPQPHRRLRTSTPILARDAKVAEVVQPAAAVATLEVAGLEAAAAKDEALSWLKALSHAG